MNEAQVEALKKSFGGPMNERQVQFLRDVQAFIDFAITNELSFPLVLATLAHDVNGLQAYQEVPGFVPKVDGYAESMAGMSEMARDPEISK